MCEICKNYDCAGECTHRPKIINSANEKAKELIGKMTMKDNGFDKKQQRHCAIICVKEIISDLKGYRMKPYLTVEQCLEASEFWEDVISELEIL